MRKNQLTSITARLHSLKDSILTNIGRGGVVCGHVNEYLFDIPVEYAGQICNKQSWDQLQIPHAKSTSAKW